MMIRGQGQWQSHIAQLKTKEERVKALRLVPDGMREAVRNHVITVFALRKWSKLYGAKK